MTDTRNEEITPDRLMDTFHGSSMRSIILFTVVVHAVVILGGSVPYFWKLIAGGDGSKLGEKERMELATREAAGSLKEIAGKYGVKPEDLSGGFAPATPAAPKNEAPETKQQARETNEKAPLEKPPVESSAPKSAIERQLDAKEAGPKLPEIEDEKEDLFK